MTYMFILKCALKLVEEIILYKLKLSEKFILEYATRFSKPNNGILASCKTAKISGTAMKM